MHCNSAYEFVPKLPSKVEGKYTYHIKCCCQVHQSLFFFSYINSLTHLTSCRVSTFYFFLLSFFLFSCKHVLFFYLSFSIYFNMLMYYLIKLLQFYFFSLSNLPIFIDFSYFLTY